MEVLRSVGHEQSEVEVSRMIAAVDKDGDGRGAPARPRGRGCFGSGSGCGLGRTGCELRTPPSRAQADQHRRVCGAHEQGVQVSAGGARSR